MNTIFKVCFWLCMIVVNVLILGGFALVLFKGSGENYLLGVIIMAIGFILNAVYMILTPILVIKDAKNRGMEPWMWAFIATFAPNFLGIILYFIVRGKYTVIQSKCTKCGNPIKDDFVVCPYCGNKQRSCKKCGKHLEHEWQACPYCGEIQ